MTVILIGRFSRFSPSRRSPIFGFTLLGIAGLLPSPAHISRNLLRAAHFSPRQPCRASPRTTTHSGLRATLLRAVLPGHAFGISYAGRARLHRSLILEFVRHRVYRIRAAAYMIEVLEHCCHG
jgi:hypothetical protein